VGSVAGCERKETGEERERKGRGKGKEKVKGKKKTKGAKTKTNPNYGRRQTHDNAKRILRKDFIAGDFVTSFVHQEVNAPRSLDFPVNTEKRERRR
jgi:hypothetical protein